VHHRPAKRPRSPPIPTDLDVLRHLYCQIWMFHEAGHLYADWLVVVFDHWYMCAPSAAAACTRIATDAALASTTRLPTALTWSHHPYRDRTFAYQTHPEGPLELAQDAFQRGWWNEYGEAFRPKYTEFIGYEAEARSSLN
jgi:hypothetical protein